jgi:N-acetylglutamate synthase-like GNAT family acetyltransferase
MLPNKNIALRPAAQTDSPAIEALLQVNKLPLDGAEAHLSGFLLAISDDRIVGCAGVEDYQPIALLRSVAIAPGLHRKGIGNLLARRMIFEAKQRGITRLYLLTVTASEYFAQLGFKRATIEEAPPALQASAEFQGACPASAAFMVLNLQTSTSREPLYLPP